MADFGGKGSRRTFAKKLLAEARLQSQQTVAQTLIEWVAVKLTIDGVVYLEYLAILTIARWVP